MAIEFDFSKIEASIDRAAKAMERLDRRIEETAKSANAFDKLFGNTKQFDEFVTSLRKLDSVSSNSFKDVARGLTDLANALSRMPRSAGLSVLLNDLVEFQKNISGFVLPPPEQLKNFFDSVVAVFSKMKDIPPLPQNLSKSLVSVTNFVKAFTSLVNATPDGIDSASENLFNLVDSLQYIFDQLNRGASVDAKILKSITSITSVVNAYLALVKDTTEESAGTEKMNQFVANLDKLISFINELDPIDDRIRKTISSISTATQLLARINKDAAIDSSPNILKFAQNISNVIGLLNSSPAVSENIRVSINTITTAIRALSKINDDALTTNIGIGIYRFFVAMRDVFTQANSLPVINENIRASINTISSSIRLLGRVAKEDIPVDMSVRIGNVFGRVAEIVNQANALPAINKDPQKALTAINAIIRALSRITGQDLPKDADARIVAFFSRLAQIVNIVNAIPAMNTGIQKSINAIANAVTALTKITNKKIDPKALDDFGTVLKKFVTDLSSVAVLTAPAIASIQAITRLLNSVGRFKTIDFVKPLEELLKGLKPILKEFQGFTGNFPSFVRLFNGLQTIAKRSKEVDFKQAKLSGFTTFVREIAAGLNELNAVKVDNAKLQAISLALASVADIQQNALRANVQGSGGGRAFSTPFAVAAGVVLGNMATKALSTIANFIRGLTTLDQSFGRTLQSIGNSVRTFTTMIDSVMRTLDNFSLNRFLTGDALQASAEFEDTATKVEVLGEVTSETRAQFEQFAEDLGKTYPIAADAALQASLDLIKAGQDLSSIKLILPSASDLVTLGEVELPKATRALILAANNFDEFTRGADGVAGGFENIATAADLFLAGAVNYPATIDSLVDGFSRVAPAAKVFGLSMSEVITILGELEAAGLRGTRGGTQISQLLRSLVSDRDIELFQNLNTMLEQIGSNVRITIREANGDMKSLDEIVKTINDAFEALGLTMVDRLEVITKTTGAWGQLGLAVLLANDGYAEQERALIGVESAQDKAARVLEDFVSQTGLLSSRLRTLNIVGFQPLIKSSLTPLVKLARGVVDFFVTLPESVFELAGNTILLTTALASLTVGVLATIKAVALFESGLFRAGGGLVLMLTNIPLTIGAIGGFIASFGLLAVTITGVGTALLSLGKLFLNTRRAIEENSGGAGDAFEDFKEKVEALANDLYYPIHELARGFDTLFGAKSRDEIQTFGTRVAGFFERLSESTHDLHFNMVQLAAVFQVFNDFVQAGFGGETREETAKLNDELIRLSQLPLVRSLFGSNVNPQRLRNAFAEIERSIRKIGNGINNVFQGTIGVLFGEEGSLEKIRRGAGQILTIVTEVFSNFTGLDFTDALVNFDAGNIRAGLINVSQTVLGELSNLIVQNRSQIGEAFAKVFQFATPLRLINIASFILHALGLDNFGNIADKISESLSEIIESGFVNAVDLLSGNISIGEALRNFVGTALGQIPDLLKTIGEELDIQPLIDFGDSLENSDALKAIETSLTNIVNLGPALVTDMFKGLEAALDAASSGDYTGVTLFMGSLLLVAGKAGLISTVLNGLKGFVFAVAVPAFGIDLLARALGNLDLLLKGDVPGFIKTTISEVASDIASIFGIDLPASTVFDRAQAALEAIGDNLPIIIQILGDKIILALSNVRANIDNSLGAFSSGFGKSFGDIQATLQGAPVNSTGDIFRSLSATSDIVDPSTMQALARRNKDLIVESFASVFERHGSVDAIPEELFRAISKSLQRTDLLDEALATFNSDDLRQQFLDRMLYTSGLNEGEKNIVNGVVQDLNTAFSDAINSGQFRWSLNPVEDRANFVIDFLSARLGSGLTPSQLSDLLNNAQLQADNVTKLYYDSVKKYVEENAIALNATDPIEVPLRVEISTIFSGFTEDLVEGFSRFVRTAQVMSRVQAPLGNNPPPFQIPGRASGGALSPYSVYGVHDTKRPEVAMFKDGTSLLFTGASGGAMTKIPGMADAPFAFIGDIANTIEGAVKGFAKTVFNKLSIATDLTNRGARPSAFTAGSFNAALKQLKATQDAEKKIKEVQDDITKIQLDFFNREQDLRNRFGLDEKYALEEFLHDRQLTLEEGSESLAEALREGNGAAAFAAQKEARKRLRELDYQYDLEGRKRKDNFDEEIRQINRDREIRLSEARQKLVDQQASNAELLADEEEFYSDSEDELNFHTNVMTGIQEEMNDDIEDDTRKTALEVAEEMNNLANGTTVVSTSVADSITRMQFAAALLASVVANAATGNNTPGAGGPIPVLPGGNPGGYPNPNSGGTGGLPWMGQGGGGSNPGSGIVPLPPVTPWGTPGATPGIPIGTMYQDDKGWHRWDGTKWVKVHGMAQGGIMESRTPYIVGDTSKAEFVTIGKDHFIINGSGRGKIIPIQPPQPERASIFPHTVTRLLTVNIGDINSMASDPAAVAQEVIKTVLPILNTAVTNTGDAKRSNSMLDG